MKLESIGDCVCTVLYSSRDYCTCTVNEKQKLVSMVNEWRKSTEKRATEVITEVMARTKNSTKFGEVIMEAKKEDHGDHRGHGNSTKFSEVATKISWCRRVVPDIVRQSCVPEEPQKSPLIS